MKTVTVEVTEDDIKNGYQCNIYNCPIAIAISRALGKPVRVGADTWSPVYHSEDLLLPLYHCENLLLPLIAYRFRVRFDNELSVTPIRFELEIPDGVSV